MSKKSILNHINQLAKALTSDTAKSAIEALRKEAENLPADEPKTKGVSPDDFDIPNEIKNQAGKVAIFSDGACRGNPGPGSYAFIIQDDKGLITKEGARAFDNTTNNRMELLGAIEGLKSLKGKNLLAVHIFTDSKYMVDGMNSWIHGWKKRGWKKADNKAPENMDLWQELDELTQKHKTSFHWVKGHAGHPQNEYVDQLANHVLDENGF